MENKKFKIRAYGKGELAMLYRPHIQQTSAVRTLNRWICKNSDLAEALYYTGYTSLTRTLTPRQVELIVGYLGEP